MSDLLKQFSSMKRKEIKLSDEVKESEMVRVTVYGYKEDIELAKEKMINLSKVFRKGIKDAIS